MYVYLYSDELKDRSRSSCSKDPESAMIISCQVLNLVPTQNSTIYIP